MNRSSESGFVATELALGIGLLVIPVALLVLTLPGWSERQVTARVISREVARRAARAGVCDAAAARALGGSMAPLEVFPSTARTIAHVTPHAWANDAFSKLLQHNGDLVTILPQLGVLLAFAAALTSVAVWQMRRTLTL